MSRPEIHDRLAASLKSARRNKGLSLDAVAKLSGVSRSMVSQIERGESSPTVATLWNLTRALQMDFAGLLDDGAASPTISVTRAGGAPTIDGHGERCRIRILSPPEQVGRFEIYELLFDAGGTLESTPHAPGAREQATVIEGRVSVSSGGATEMLGPGDTARYAADCDHALRAADGPARVFLVVEGG